MAKKTKAAPKKKVAKITPRKHMRYAPDAGTIAKIDITEMPLTFQPSITGLVTEESYSGCGLVILSDEMTSKKLKINDRVVVQVGKLDPMMAEVRWRAQLDNRVLRLGLLYIA